MVVSQRFGVEEIQRGVTGKLRPHGGSTGGDRRGSVGLQRKAAVADGRTTLSSRSTAASVVSAAVAAVQAAVAAVPRSTAVGWPSRAAAVGWPRCAPVESPPSAPVEPPPSAPVVTYQSAAPPTPPPLWRTWPVMPPPMRSLRWAVPPRVGACRSKQEAHQATSSRLEPPSSAVVAALEAAAGRAARREPSIDGRGQHGDGGLPAVRCSTKIGQVQPQRLPPVSAGTGPSRPWRWGKQWTQQCGGGAAE